MRRGRWQGRPSCLVALPERTYSIAEAVIPLRPAGRKTPDLVAAGSAVPRLGNELDLAEDGILTACIEKSTALVEPRRLSRQNSSQIEAETVVARLLRPIPQGIRH
jgi:hypothetical protein